MTELLKTMKTFGYGPSQKEVLTWIGDYLNINTISNPFKNGYSKEDWQLGFSYKKKLSLKKLEIVYDVNDLILNMSDISNVSNLLNKIKRKEAKLVLQENLVKLETDFRSNTMLIETRKLYIMLGRFIFKKKFIRYDF